MSRPIPSSTPPSSPSSASAQGHNRVLLAYLKKSSPGAASPVDGSIATPRDTVNISFEQIHDSSSSVQFPNSSYATEERKRNNSSASDLKKLEDIEKLIKSLRKKLKELKNNGSQKMAVKTRQQIKEKAFERHELRKKLGIEPESSQKNSGNKKMPESRTSEKSSQNTNSAEDINAKLAQLKVSLRKANDGNKEKEAARLEKEIKKLEDLRKDFSSSSRSSIRKESSAPAVANSPETLSSLIQKLPQTYLKDDRVTSLLDIVARIGDRKQVATENLKKLEHNKAPVDQIIEAKEQVNQLCSEIETLIKAIGLLATKLAEVAAEVGFQNRPKQASSSIQSPDGGEHTPISTRKILKRATTRHRDGHSSSTPLSKLDSPNRKSTLYPKEEVRNILNTKGKQKYDGLKSVTDALSDELDALQARQTSLQKSIGIEKNPKTQVKLIEELKQVDRKIINAYKKLEPYLIKTEAIEQIALPKGERLSAKEKEKRYNALIGKFRSARTARLEKTYLDLLDEFKKSNDRSLVGSTLRPMGGGTVANASTFSVGNGLSRGLNAPLASAGMSAWSSFIGATASGTLHALLTTPILKQVMRETWTSPALADYNNYFKLKGASWGDWWRGEEDKPKYASKNPDSKELLTIKQRLAEEKPFTTLLGDRYRVEEAPYYFFSLNYLLKSLGSGFLPAAAPDKSVFAGLEAGMHIPAGWISGAETSLLIHSLRSEVPGAKLLPSPPREIAAAEAAYLDALLHDLREAHKNIGKDQQITDADFNDRELTKAILKVEKALASAELRSGFLGTFRNEFWAQFATKDATADTIAEIVARISVLLSTSLASNLVADWRNSKDPVMAFLGHAIPAASLIIPIFGWTMRPLVSGLVRGVIQAFINGRAPGLANSKLSEGTTVVDVGGALKSNSPDGADDSVVISVDSETFEDTTEASEESSAVVGAPSENDATESDDEWHGNANPNFAGY